jgi:hypothetical protein
MINAEPSWSRGNQPDKDYDVHNLWQIQEIVEPIDERKPLLDSSQLNSADRDNLSTIKLMQHKVDSSPIMSRQPQTNSTDETKYVMMCGKGIPAPTIVSYITLYWLVMSSLFPPEMAKNTPSEMRARRTANCSRKRLPDNAKRLSASAFITAPRRTI